MRIVSARRKRIEDFFFFNWENEKDLEKFLGENWVGCNYRDKKLTVVRFKNRNIIGGGDELRGIVRESGPCWFQRVAELSTTGRYFLYTYTESQFNEEFEIVDYKEE